MSTPSILLGLLLGSATLGDRVALAGGGHLEWDAPADACPDAAAVGALVDQHLAPRGDAATGVRVSASASAGADGRWAIAVRIETTEGTATRALEAADCRAAAETVALAVALAVGPEPGSREVPPAPEPDPTDVDPPAATDDPPATPDADVAAPDDPPTDDAADPTDPTTPPDAIEPTTRAPPRRLVVDLALGGGLTFGHVARLGAVTHAQVALVARRFQVSLRADHLVRRRVLLADRTDAGGLLSFTSGVLEAGPVLRPGPLEVPLLAGLAVGAVRARGFGSDHDAVRTVPWAAIGVGPGVRWAPLPRLVLGLRAELSIALVRHAFTLGPARPLASTGLVAGHAWATLGLRLP